MLNKLLVLDVETSGLIPGVHSLLSIGLVVWDNGQITTQKEILIQPSGVIDPKAMEINKIDLKKHEKVALHYQDARNALVNFIKYNFDLDEGKVIIAGHNVKFDFDFLKTWMDKDQTDNKFLDFFSFRTIDTYAISHFLHLVGEHNKNTLTLDGLLKEYDVKIPKKDRHTALGDALGTAMILTEMVEFLTEMVEYIDLCLHRQDDIDFYY